MNLKPITFNYKNEKNTQSIDSPNQVNNNGEVNLDYNKTPDENPYPEKKHVGLIAQDVQKILPEAVYPWLDDNNNEKLGIAYSELTPLLVKVCQDLKTENDSLKTRIENLEQENNAHLQRTTTLEQKTQTQEGMLSQLLEKFIQLETLVNKA